MFSRTACAAALLAAALQLVPAASAQATLQNGKSLAETFSKVQAIFGGQAELQASFEEARAEHARMEGALQLSENLEARFRANGATASADIYRKAADSLRPAVEHLQVVFAKLDTLDTPLDEARGRAAYDRVKAELTAVLQLPMTEQYQYSKTHGLKEEPLRAIQVAAETLIAVAERKSN